jgi:hypothetical protein
MNVLPSTWVFKCKRYPDGLVRKLKARFCAGGHRQVEGRDYFETFAPVVNWQTVRIMLILTLILNLSTKQVDYTAAFMHAPIDRDPNWENLSEDEGQQSGVYIEMPRGLNEQGKVIKLKKSLYGLKQSLRNFFLHLKEKLEEVGLRQSESDACLFISDKVICPVYLDGTLLYSPKQEFIDEIIAKLRAEEMELEAEDDVAGFLGVHIDRQADDTILLTQKGLTKRIVKALNVTEMRTKETPAEYRALPADKDGEPPQGIFSYPSVIGMLQYLQGHSRPDITFAISQCARYTHNTKRSHEKALLCIGHQYLKGMADKGLILKPLIGDQRLNIDCYVDAEFARLWGYEGKQDPLCVKSRTGFVIFIANCPAVVWSSKLQPDIATSTMEAEYQALSVAMREVIPLLNLVKEIGSNRSRND